MSPTHAPIAILGAGPSGLALGRLLELANIDHVIFERDESADAAYSASRSGTLDIHTGSGQLALERAGLFEEFKALARWGPQTVLADGKGEEVFRFEGEGDEDRPEIDRKDLRALLLRSVLEHRIQWNSKVQKVNKDDDGTISIHFADGQVKSGFSLVVGADGAWSKTRPLVTPAKPIYAGYHYITTTLSPSSPYYHVAQELAGNGNYISTGNGRLIAAQLLGDGSYYIIVGLHLPEDWTTKHADELANPAALREQLIKDHFDGWSSKLTNLMLQSDGDFRPWPLYYLPEESMGWDTVPGVVLIGDAAHLTLPNGDGVNVALHDSVLLVQQITKHGLDNLTAAVAEFEKEMFIRAKAHIVHGVQISALMLDLNEPGPHKFLQAIMDEAGEGH